MNGKDANTVRDPSDYNESLIRRGEINLWLNSDVMDKWYTANSELNHKFKQVYSDDCIRCGLRLRALYNLPLRAIQGLLQSLFSLAGIDLKVPHYSTFCRRQESMEPILERTAGESETGALIAIDSTGIKVFGEGEWKTRMYGYNYRRAWRKLHDVTSHEVKAVVVSTNDFKDGELLDDLLDQLPPNIEKFFADGAYESFQNFQSIQQVGAIPVVPPRKDAKIRQHGNSSKPALARDRTLRDIRRLGKSGWKKATCYHLRNIAETAMFRFKEIFGDKLQARTFKRQVVELIEKCSMLNIMTALGMPRCYEH